MAAEKYEIEKFKWSEKIQLILTYQMALKGLEDPKSLPITLTA